MMYNRIEMWILKKYPWSKVYNICTFVYELFLVGAKVLAHKQSYFSLISNKC